MRFRIALNCLKIASFAVLMSAAAVGPRTLNQRIRPAGASAYPSFPFGRCLPKSARFSLTTPRQTFTGPSFASASYGVATKVVTGG